MKKGNFIKWELLEKLQDTRHFRKPILLFSAKRLAVQLFTESVADAFELLRGRVKAT